MNKKIQNVLHSRYFYIVISVLVAIAIWIVALNTSNPVVESTVEVSILYINETIPAERKLTRTSAISTTTATVKVSGRRNTINNLLASELKVYADFADVTEAGVTHLKISKPKCDRVGIKVLDYYPKEIDVTYDTKSELYLDVKTEYTNAILASGYEFISVTTEPDSIPVSGFASDVEGLDHVKVSLSDNIQNGTINSNRTISLIGRYINNAGHDVTANFNTEKVLVKIEVAKRVPVKYSVAGSPATDHYIVKHGISDGSVLLQGDSDALSKITEINLGNIDVSGKTSAVNKEVDLKNLLPSGITVYGESKRNITVNIEKYISREIVLGIDDISISGKNDAEFEYTIKFIDELNSKDGKIRIVLKGKAAAVESTSISALKPMIDLTDKGIGSYKNQRISLSAPDGVTIIGEYDVDVDITVKPVIETVAPSETIFPTGSETPSVTETPSPTETPVLPSET